MSKQILFLCFIIPVLLLVILLLRRSIAGDRKSQKRYKNAASCKGTVLEQLEDYRVNAYSSGVIGVHTRKYHQYRVEYVLNGTTHYGILRTKEHLTPGSRTDMKYAYDERAGRPQILDTTRGDRVRELEIGVVFGVILAVLLIILKSKGLM